jgi:hypothetical protein
MTRLFTIMFVIATTASVANAQFDEGLPMTDQLGGGPSYSSPTTTGNGRTSRPQPTRTNTPTYQPQRTNTVNNNNGIRPTYQPNQLQQAQNIANAVAALGPAIQQVRQNAQQLRAQNGGYLIRRNNNNRAGGRVFQPRNRYGDYFTPQDAQQVRRDLIRDGYQNVQIAQHPHNGQWQQENQPSRRRWGVFGSRRR